MSWHTMERGATLDSTCDSGHLQVDKKKPIFIKMNFFFHSNQFREEIKDRERGRDGEM